MKPLFTFILGALLMVAIGVFAQSSGITIFKPAVPKKVMVRYYSRDMSSQIQQVLSQGWFLKSVSFQIAGQYGQIEAAIVVYEKY